MTRKIPEVISPNCKQCYHASILTDRLPFLALAFGKNGPFPRFPKNCKYCCFDAKIHSLKVHSAQTTYISVVWRCPVSGCQYSTVQYRRWHQYRQHTGWTQLHTTTGLGCWCWPPLETAAACCLSVEAGPTRATTPNTIWASVDTALVPPPHLHCTTTFIQEVKCVGLRLSI